MKWLLTHDGDKVKNLIEISDTDKIYTNKNVFIGETQDECFTQVDNNGLSFIFTSGKTKEIIFKDGGRSIKDIIIND